MNKVILMGRVTRDPELKTTKSGLSVCRFSVAVDRPYQKKEKREVDFFTCTAWRKTAENIARFFPKGRMIAIEGSLQQRSWTDATGQKHSTVEVVVDRFYFTGEKATRAGSTTSPTSTAIPAAAPAKAPVATPSATSAADPFDDFYAQAGSQFGDDDFIITDGTDDDLPF